MKPTEFNAVDYDEAASGYISKGQFELARLALLKRNALRQEGDTSTAPTPFQAEDYEELALKLDSEGNYSLANTARTVAAAFRSGYKSLE
jgi:hypothetical protein